MRPENAPSAAVIGFGRVGSSLTQSFLKHGIKVRVLVPGPDVDPLPPLPDDATYFSPGSGVNTIPEPVCWFISLPEEVTDDEILKLTGQPFFDAAKDCIACVSATYDVSSISKQAGISIARAHPLHPFSPMQHGTLLPVGTPVAVQDMPSWALSMLVAIGAQPFVLNEEMRNLYHAAAVIISNLPGALASISAKIFQQVGVPNPEQQTTMMLSALARILSESGIHAVPGPAARGDVRTVTADQAAIEQHDRNTGAVHQILSDMLLAQHTRPADSSEHR